jgi:biopolymer transport protein TolQ
MWLLVGWLAIFSFSGATDLLAQDAKAPEQEKPTEVDVEEHGVFSRAAQGGPVVFSCLMILIGLSISTWAIIAAKYFFLRKMAVTSELFIKSFWDSRSLNDLNGRLQEYPFSPVREVFRSGYNELVRGSQLRDQAVNHETAVHAAMENLQRTLQKAKNIEKRKLEKFMPILAITASASPFIGLFGTVWGIMNAFEGIARTGSASLAAVAPGISEALIATAFGLGAAIPAAIGYNVFVARIRSSIGDLDGFSIDLLNIVERYLVTDKPKHAAPQSGTPTPL